MRILNWVQSKIAIREEQKKRQDVANGSHSYGEIDESDSHKKVPSELPHGLLTIGTLGNSAIRGKTVTNERAENSCSKEDIPDFTIEELNKLQGALTKLLSRKSRESEKGTEGNNLPLDRFLNCPSSLEIERCTCQKPCSDVGKEEGCISPATKAILSRMKDVLVENRNSIHRRSFTFLLKKMFVCRGGFAPAPSLRDPLPSWRMEKILKSILHQKIHRRNSTRASTRRVLDNRPVDEDGTKEKIDGRADNKCKWVKTDPEYIVLEI